MTADGQETIADAANIIATDDAESSTKTIIERSSGKVASGDGGGNDQAIIITADEFPSPAPKSSNITEICDLPSTKRSGTSIVSTNGLHNDAVDRDHKAGKCSKKQTMGDPQR
jgi:hypothetical protein